MIPCSFSALAAGLAVHSVSIRKRPEQPFTERGPRAASTGICVCHRAGSGPLQREDDLPFAL